MPPLSCRPVLFKWRGEVRNLRRGQVQCGTVSRVYLLQPWKLLRRGCLGVHRMQRDRGFRRSRVGDGDVRLLWPREESRLKLQRVRSLRRIHVLARRLP